MVDAAAAARDDFYEIFELDPGSDTAALTDALRAARKRWRQLAGSPDRERSQRAERRMAQLDIAHEVLLDEAARADYDAALNDARQQAPALDAQQHAEQNRQQAPASSTDWGRRAEEYLEQNDARNAMVAATRGTEADPDDARSWLMFTRAAVELKQLDQADFGSAELLHRAPIALNHSFRAQILDDLGRRADAERHFREAARLDPTRAFDRARAAWAVLDQGRVDDALTEAWRVVEAFPDDEFPRRVVRAACDELRRRRQPQRALVEAARLLNAHQGEDENMQQVVWSIEAIADMGDLDAALTEAWRLVDAFPKRQAPRETVTDVVRRLREHGRESEALRVARQLLDRFPEDEKVKYAFGWTRLREAESKMAATGPETHAILNRAQAEYVAGAIAEIASLNVRADDLNEAAQSLRQYHAGQIRVSVRLGFWKVVLALVALFLIWYGLTQLGLSFVAGAIPIVIGALLGWALWASSFARKYRRDAKLQPRHVRDSGIR